MEGKMNRSLQHRYDTRNRTLTPEEQLIIMNRFITSSCLLCLWLAISLQSGGSIFANANKVKVRRLSSNEQQRKGLPSYRTPNSNNNIDHITITLTNTTATNTTNATASVAPTPALVPSTPTPPPTPTPTKKYIPAPDDEEGEVEKEATKIGWIFLYIVIIFAFIWVIIYFRDAIGFFLANVSMISC